MVQNENRASGPPFSSITRKWDENATSYGLSVIRKQIIPKRVVPRVLHKIDLRDTKAQHGNLGSFLWCKVPKQANHTETLGPEQWLLCSGWRGRAYWKAPWQNFLRWWAHPTIHLVSAYHLLPRVQEKYYCRYDLYL